MNLERVRRQLTLLFAVLAALAVLLIAVVAARLGEERIEQSVERDAERHYIEALLGNYWEDGFDVRNTWTTNTETDWFETKSASDVEPPVLYIADNAGPDRSGFTKFEQDGDWLAYARYVDDVNVLIVVESRSEALRDISSLRWRIGLAALGFILFTSLVGYWFAGRFLAPARLAMEQQRDFIADAAHELRTPLAVIQASASQALSRERHGDEYKTSLHEIRSAAERAGSGVGELLELARIQSGRAAPRISPLRLDLLVEEVGATTMVDGVDIIGSPGEPLVVDADYNLLRQAVVNVTTNAAARAKRVELRAYTDGAWSAVEITDDGPGFDPEVLPHVFERFRRGDERGSVGLGMAIVRTIIETHGGRCEASNCDGGGAKVRLLLKA